VHAGLPATHPRATVVALAEGFQTSFWRLDETVPDAQFRWVSVDLPPVVELRRRLLPDSPRITNLAQSALDYSWMDLPGRADVLRPPRDAQRTGAAVLIPPEGANAG
jgi:hypothetical protein